MNLGSTQACLPRVLAGPLGHSWAAAPSYEVYVTFFLCYLVISCFLLIAVVVTLGVCVCDTHTPDSHIVGIPMAIGAADGIAVRVLNARGS